MMNTLEKLQWCRDHWDYLKTKEKLNGAIQKILDKDEYLQSQFSVQDIIDIEESMTSSQIPDDKKRENGK